MKLKQIEQRTLDSDLFHPWEQSLDIPFDPKAESFYKAKGLEKAYSDFYEVPHDMERLSAALQGVRARGFQYGYSKKHKKEMLEASRTPLLVYVETSSPVKGSWGAWHRIKPESFGHIFKLLVDVTKHVYDLDAEAWYRKGKSTPPAVRDVHPESGIINREPSELITMADFRDLFIEGISFALDKDWPMQERFQRGFLGSKKKRPPVPHAVDPKMEGNVLGRARLLYGW